MKNAESRARRTGFTMVEVIVVIGIIAILAAVMMPMLRGTRESALAAQCKNNMRNVAQGVLSCAQAHEYGHFPAAGYYRSVWGVDLKEQKPLYHPHRPWINNKGSVALLNKTLTTVYLGDVASFADSEEEVRTVITNGAIWHAVGTAYEVYRCPVHARNFKKAKGRLPGWSYMMNQEFGFNRGEGVYAFFGGIFGASMTVATDATGNRKEKASRSPDKVLMFAEVQGADVDDKKNGISLKTVVSGDTETDAVLEYAQEDMGFTHPLGKGKYGGNVAFADGHVDTIVLPQKGMSVRDLTRYLCQGFDVPHDGRPYKPDDNDK